MAYSPVGEKHAINQVIFQFTLDGELKEADLGAVHAAHARWDTLLPRMVPIETFQFDPATQRAPVALTSGVAFQRYKTDGTPAWELLFDEDRLTLKCSAYSSWKEISRSVFPVLGSALAAIKSEVSVKSILYQVIDKFIWDGERSACRPDYLFNLEDDLFPKFSSNYQALWHLNQGYFDPSPAIDIEGIVVDRCLNRISVDSALRDGGRLTSVVDHLLRVDLDEQISVSEAKEKELPAKIEKVFEILHSDNKNLMKRILVSEMQERISLND